MRSLPWANNDDKPETEVANPLKRKRNTRPKTPISRASEVESLEVAEESDSQETTIAESSEGDKAFDAMIPGYDHDDAYIMVEHDLIEAAKQLTRELHLEAYQKQSLAPLTETILRPTAGGTRHKRKVESASEDESDEEVKGPGTLVELLARRPADRGLTAKPIKQKGGLPQREVRRSKDITEEEDIAGRKTGRKDPIIREIVKNAVARETIVAAAETDDEDDEDLDKPIRKKGGRLAASHERYARKSSLNPPPLPNKRIKPSSDKPSLDPDWLFNSLWEENDRRPARPPAKRDKVSLATQLEETSFKLLGKKKAVSLKDQFKFLES